MAWLSDKETEEFSSHSWNDGQWYALREWVDPRNVGDGVWAVQPEFPAEVASVLAYIRQEKPKSDGDEKGGDNDEGLRPFRSFVG